MDYLAILVRIPVCGNEAGTHLYKLSADEPGMKGRLRFRGQDSPTVPGGAHFSGPAPSCSCTSWPIAATTWSVSFGCRSSGLLIFSHVTAFPRFGGTNAASRLAYLLVGGAAVAEGRAVVQELKALVPW